ncbi:MAG: BMP family ABC transporter substrate-binding protein [Atopobium sp.]|uniref:BMP family ABC transporter substrate-binding protein n=1 Tax=Atopobium sp. TaxID=1872650 RepID=UPI002A74AF89|nr:BMP family ABC transporter substrate-binding protein [Atopobium sp.]MDY2788248.1 BMP family ABC transporter substrate-binding protein [Atopobium sp.]MDY4522786.1 BMP family ABC transporter substrate-binding protein [Atopobium sp.]
MLNRNLSRRDFLGASAAFAVTLGLGACSKGGSQGGSEAKSSYKISMITDTGGVNDQSFNQGSWEGLKQLEKDKGWKVNYLESKQESDYASNLDKAVDDEANLIWGIGFAMADAVADVAKKNKNVQFAIIDNAYETPVENLTGVTFRAQEPSFMVGYIAARTTKTNKVGFVGGISGVVIDQFDYGYKAGIAYANKENGTNVEVLTQYADSFTDSAKGKAIASKMFSDGCDIVFHAAGGVGAGVIEAAKEVNKFAIGVDRDQAYLAPDNVLTSALKKVDKAIIEVSTEIQGGAKGGRNIELGAAEGCVGIPEDHPHIDDAVYKAAIAFESKFKDGSVVPPMNKEKYDEYVAAL